MKLSESLSALCPVCLNLAALAASLCRFVLISRNFNIIHNQLIGHFFPHRAPHLVKVVNVVHGKIDLRVRGEICDLCDELNLSGESE